MFDWLNSLSFDAIIGCNHQHHDVCHIRTPGSHGIESCMPRGVNEGYCIIGRKLDWKEKTEHYEHHKGNMKQVELSVCGR